MEILINFVEGNNAFVNIGFYKRFIGELGTSWGKWLAPFLVLNRKFDEFNEFDRTQGAILNSFAVF